MEINGQKLFLVEGIISYTPYMGDTEMVNGRRLVWAPDYEAAKKKYTEYWESKSVEYSRDYFVCDVDVTESI